MNIHCIKTNCIYNIDKKKHSTNVVCLLVFSDRLLYVTYVIVCVYIQSPFCMSNYLIYVFTTHAAL